VVPRDCRHVGDGVVAFFLADSAGSPIRHSPICRPLPRRPGATPLPLPSALRRNDSPSFGPGLPLRTDRRQLDYPRRGCRFEQSTGEPRPV